MSKDRFVCRRCGRVHPLREYVQDYFCRECGTFLSQISKDVNHTVDPWMKLNNSKISLFPYAPYPQQIEFMKDISEVVVSRGVLIAEACSGFGKTICALSSVLELGNTVIYATRTHEQARQVLHEVEAINAKSNRSFSAVNLASRRHLCLDDRCRSLPLIESSEACRILRETGRCPYRTEAIILPSSLPSVLSIQRLQSQGRALKFCPYFLARKAAESATVTVAPYQYVFNEAIRAKAKLELEGKVLIFDEAHNADKIGLEALSDTISERGLSNAKKELDLVGASSDFIEAIQRYLDENVSDEPKTKPGLKLRVELNEVLGVDDLQSFVDSLSRIIEEVRMRKLEVGEVPASYLSGLCAFLSLVALSDSDRYIAVYRRSILGLELLEYRCLDPSLAIQPVVEKALGAIIMSGTLSPLRLFAEVIGLPYARLRTYSAIARPSNIRLFLDTSVTSRFSERSDSMTLRYGKRIAEISERIPNGLLIFFTQRSLMLRSVSLWREKHILKESQGRLLLGRKPIFIEGETAAQNRLVIEEYKRETYNKDGAALFAIFRGRNAEGSNFPDEEARGILLVGVPYADYHDPVVRAQINYFNNRETGFGRRWYTMDAFRAANQAIGRGIRHREDWCIYVLMDQRYQSRINMITEWARAKGAEPI